MNRYYLGLDSSTQSISAVLIDISNNQIVYEQAVDFSTDLNGYGVTDGFLSEQEKGVVHAPPLMWVEALDSLLLHMQTDGCQMEKIIAVSGSAQQHGSVYLNNEFNKTLSALDPDITLHEQLNSIFSRTTSPIWMDTSTSMQCEVITAAFGSADKVVQATGSVAVERFTGAQIMKFAQQQPNAFQQTAQVMLISSFMASLFAGHPVGIDYTDASGMNLLDIRNKTWHPTALAVCGNDLGDKLLPAIDPAQPIGVIADYFVHRYGFSPTCQLLPWSGDNPSSLIGLGLVVEGMTAISLGTSNTCFGLMHRLPEHMSQWAHTFITPSNDYMMLLCMKNGSLARDAIRQQFKLSWPQFTAAINSKKPGGDGAMMLPWFDSEIVPKVENTGVQRFALDANDAAANCRAVVEGQMMSMRNHAEEAGLIPTSLRATGGASQNKAILQIMANVFACPVEVLNIPNSAALGAALRAVQAIEQKTWLEVVAEFSQTNPDSRVEPDANSTLLYQQLRKTYAEREANFLV